MPHDRHQARARKCRDHAARADSPAGLGEFISQWLDSPAGRGIAGTLISWYNGSNVDEFGLDTSLVEFLRPLFQFLYYQYFRVDALGVGHIPAKGPAIIVGNHAGAFPYDGAMVHLAVYNNHRRKRGVRFLVDDFVYDLPILGTFIQRIGGVRASQENAQKLIEAGHLIAVFPEGTKGIGKCYDERYRLQRMGRGGFVRLAMRTRAPIVPVAIVGSEETHPIIWKSQRLARPLGLPFVPFTPTFPWLGPLGLVPLPSKWKIMFAQPVRFDRYSAKDAEDEELVNEEALGIKATIQQMLDQALKERKTVWL
ncbi:MAG: lysophospholipid acyltransferase family protein [bacterium]